jgi:hypothetical protein
MAEAFGATAESVFIGIVAAQKRWPQLGAWACLVNGSDESGGGTGLGTVGWGDEMSRMMPASTAGVPGTI